jgi:hypothetical protein
MNNTSKVFLLFLGIVCSPFTNPFPNAAKAQYVAVPYGFQTQPAGVPDYDAFGNISLPMDYTCLAANGYGQWMYGNNGGAPEAILVGDSISAISTLSDFPRPSGVVSESVFSNDQSQTYVRVATNLVGSTRYVWPDAGGIGFVIRGINDSRGGTQGTQIDITYSANNGNLNPIANRQVISGSPFAPTTNVSNNVNNWHHQMSGYAQGVENDEIGTKENNSQDNWDIAMDAKYLYIVWEHYDLSYGSATYEIYVNAILLSDGSIAPNFPLFLHDRRNDPPTTTSTNGRGRRPTVSCDVRNFPSAPTCDIVYLQDISLPANSATPQNALVRYCAIRNGVIHSDIVLPTTLFIPGRSNPNTYSNPLHARILTSSQRGLTFPVKDVYVVAGTLQDPTIGLVNSNFLLVDRIEDDNPQPPANTTVHYVDGERLINHSAPLLGGAFKVVDDPVRAFANPYDGQATIAYDEFHALYRLQRFSTSTPLLIVRGSNNGVGSTTDTRTTINRTSIDNGMTWTWLPDPDERFLGAVNQAGLHIHWHGYDPQSMANLNFYSRDIRAFDEPIEENTLLSYEARVTDGGSHLGTLGAALDPGRQFTIWTDPVFNNGMLFVASPYIIPSWSNGRLKFGANNCILSIGSGLATDPRSTLTILPNFECWFGGTGQELSLKANSLCNYYGVPGGQLVENFKGPGTIRLTGSGIVTTSTMAGHSFPSSIAHEALMNIRAGSRLQIPGNLQLLSDQGHIDLNYGQNFDPNSTSVILSGRITAIGHVSLANSFFIAHIPSIAADLDRNAYKTPICSNNCIPLPFQFEASESLFQNVDVSGSMNLFFTETQLPAKIIGGKLSGVSVRGSWVYPYANPDVNPFEIGYVRVEGIHNFGIWMKYSGDNAAVHYHNMYIHHNDFRTFTTANADGILLEGFNTDNTSFTGTETQVAVSNNTFTTNVGFTDTNHVKAAIHFVRTSGGILSNAITGVGYANGVILEEDGSATALTNTLVCNNAIAGCVYANHTGSGIASEYWNGYGKMNKIDGCNRSLQAGTSSKPYIIFSNYSNSNGAGIFVSATNAAPDLRGVSHAGHASLDYAAYDTLLNNNQNSQDAAELILVPSSTISLGDNVGACIGKNNFVANTLGEVFVSSSASASIASVIDGNYWQHSGAPYSPALTGDLRFHNISYVRDASDPTAPSYLNCAFASTVSCSGGFISPTTHKGGVENITLSTDTNECVRLERVTRAYLTDNYPVAYDTGRYYLEHCSSLNAVWHEFTDMDFANQYRNTNALRYLDYREWLKSVLYLNTVDSNWYCADAFSIITSFRAFIPPNGYDANATLAVVTYLLSSGKCPLWINDLTEDYVKIRAYQRQHWIDTSLTDSNRYKLDTTLPSLHSLGLDILLGPQAHVEGSFASFDIANLHTTQNPFTKETEIAFILGDRELMQLKVYDALGRMVYDNGFGNVLESGKQSFKINGKAWPTGTYYARISSIRGIVRTVKLEHVR